MSLLLHSSLHSERCSAEDGKGTKVARRDLLTTMLRGKVQKLHTQGPNIYGKTERERYEGRWDQNQMGSKKIITINKLLHLLHRLLLCKKSVSLIVLPIGVMNCSSSSEMFLIGTHVENRSLAWPPNPKETAG